MNKCKNADEGIRNKVFVKYGIQFEGKEHATVKILHFCCFLLCHECQSVLTTWMDSIYLEWSIGTVEYWPGIDRNDIRACDLYNINICKNANEGCMLQGDSTQRKIYFKVKAVFLVHWIPENRLDSLWTSAADLSENGITMYFPLVYRSLTGCICAIVVHAFRRVSRESVIG